MSIASAARAMLAKRGRTMTLRRRQGTGATFTTADAKGTLRAFQPNELAGQVILGDARIILDAAPVVAATLSPPVKGDQVVADGRTWAVQGATPRYDGATLVSFELWVRGG